MSEESSFINSLVSCGGVGTSPMRSAERTGTTTPEICGVNLAPFRQCLQHRSTRGFLDPDRNVLVRLLQGGGANAAYQDGQTIKGHRAL